MRYKLNKLLNLWSVKRAIRVLDFNDNFKCFHISLYNTLR